MNLQGNTLEDQSTRFHTPFASQRAVKVRFMKLDGNLRIKVTSDVKSRLGVIARLKDRSVSWLARHYIQNGLVRDERRARKTTVPK